MARGGTARAQDRLSGVGPASPEPDPPAPRLSRPERKALLFANVASRQGAMDLAPALEVLRAGGVHVLEERPPDVRQLGAWILEHRSTADLVIIGGGDGTINAAAEALVEAGLPLGILPLGTANDLARTLEIPVDPVEASLVITEGATHRIDLGRVNGKHFFNVASMGLSVHVARELGVEIKRRWGVLGYPLTLWRALGRHQSFRAEIRCNGTRARVRAIQISVGNGRHYGGGMTIAADAAIDDGMLDVVSVAPQGVLELAVNLPAFRWGWHERAPRLRHWRCRDIEIRTVRPLPINTDGEVTTQTPATIAVVPGAIAVYVPQTFRASRGGDNAAG
ncbi:MAG TPA: lipid kinase [Geminicoccaceae bacterium]